MPDSQSSEPGFESPFVTVSKIGHFRSLSCINECLAIDSGGNVSDLALARNCCMARMLPGEAALVSEWTGLPGRAKSVKRFERSNGLDTALYKNYLLNELAQYLKRCRWDSSPGPLDLETFTLTHSATTPHYVGRIFYGKLVFTKEACFWYKR